MKVNLNFAKETQIQGDNLRKLYNKLKDKFREIFADLTVEGEFVEPPKEEAKEKKQKKKSSTPMEVLKEKGVPGKDLGIINKLWQAGKKIDQETLKSEGFSHENLGMVVNIFNGMLKEK